MVIYNAATRELTAKIVYYGPGLCGKTTNLKVLHDRLEPGTVGKLLNLQTQTDRTIYFDLLPVELGDIKGYKIRFQLATVPGQTAFNETRRVVLKGVDGIVFAVDSQWTMLPKNLESWQNLKDNLKVNGISFESVPIVIQYNKRDLSDILSVDAMQEALGLSSYAFVEAVASAGRGVTETFKLISKLTFVDLLRRLQGRKSIAEESAAPLPTGDDLLVWKDSLLNRESHPGVARPSRPLALVPPADEPPFDTTELGRGVDDEDVASPYAVRAPSGMAAPPARPDDSAATIQLEAVGMEELDEVAEVLEEADEISEILVPPDTVAMAEVESRETSFDANTTDPGLAPPRDRESVADPTFLPIEEALEEKIGILEQRLREATERGASEREAVERLEHSMYALQEDLSRAIDRLTTFQERYSGLETSLGGLHESIGSLFGRLAPLEALPQRHGEAEASLRAVEERLEGAVRGLHERLDMVMGGVNDRLEVAANQQRKDSDVVAVSLQGFSEKAQALEAQITALVNQLGSHDSVLETLRTVVERLPQMETQIEALFSQQRYLETNLDEKNVQGRREAEDIRSQIAPLLEERVRRHESDALLFSEMERLRQSLADSLQDLAERLRSAIRD